MNSDQFASILRSLLKMGGVYLMAHGVSTSTTQLISGLVLAVAGVLFSHWANADGATPSSSGGKLGLFLAVGFLAFAVVGCGTVYNSNKITAVKERGFGIVIAESAANQTPEMKMGFFSSVIQIIPTATTTNGTIETPRYMDTFELEGSANPLDTSIKENTGTGKVLVGSGTNDTSKAIEPGPYVVNTNSVSK